MLNVPSTTEGYMLLCLLQATLNLIHYLLALNFPVTTNPISSTTAHQSTSNLTAQTHFAAVANSLQSSKKPNENSMKPKSRKATLKTFRIFLVAHNMMRSDGSIEHAPKKTSKFVYRKPVQGIDNDIKF